MHKPESFPIEKIYVPVKRKKAIRPEIVEEIAGSILEIGQQAPILVRPDEDRFVLVEGLHRLEACKALGETTIIGVVVSAELAQHRMPLRESPEAAAEHDKMARLKKLRLEKEAAEKPTATLAAKWKQKRSFRGPIRQRACVTIPRRHQAGLRHRRRKPCRNGSHSRSATAAVISLVRVNG